MRRRLLEGRPSSAAPSGYTVLKLRETLNLKTSTLARSGKSSTNVACAASFGGHSSVREIVPTS